MSAVRIGAVSYLNTWPLVRGLRGDAARFDVRFDVPSRCAALLHEGAIDVGLIPSIEFLRGDYAIAPDVAIASEGPVASVALFSRVPVAGIRRIALDTSSRTSAALVRVLCVERFGIAPSFESRGPDLEAMLREHDAALVIGDNALYADHVGLGLLKVDLGEEWTAHTRLPFVWAFWAGSPEALSPQVCGALRASRDLGVTEVDAIASEYAAGDRRREEVARRYFRDNMRYHLGDRHLTALERFYRSAEAAGAVAQARPPRLAGAAASRRDA
jgi:chorismate dehydratase